LRLSYLLITVLALAPRVAGLGQFVTSDEANFWIARSAAFIGAMRAGDFAATALSVHPGATTMRLGGLGTLAVRAARAWGWLEATPFPLRLAVMQLPIALVHSAGVLLGYALLRRLLPAQIAFAAAVLWACDPFVVGYSRILHVDALAGTFATLALLAACAYWFHEPRGWLIVLSGACAAAAALSKSPALAAAAIVALIALAAWRRGARLRPLVIWCVAAAVTAAILWPALWAAPERAAGELVSGVEAEGASPHEQGNFFLGQAYSDQGPPATFYPVALALRTTPLTLACLLLLPLALRAAPAASRRDMAALAAFAVLFVVAMTIFPKKFNRYLVPVFPSLDILAACGLGSLLGWWPRVAPAARARPHVLVAAWRSSRRAGALAAIALLPLVAATNLYGWHPYELAAFNQLLGGAAAGEQAFQIGWGEGYEQAAAWLNQQDDITGVVVAAARTETIQPYLRTGAQSFAPSGSYLPPSTGYAVVYVRDTQSGQPWPPFDRFYQSEPPIYTVRIHGVDYVWIYQVPPPTPRPLAATFGASIRLRGLDMPETAAPGDMLNITLFWQATQAPASRYALFIHLIGADGRRYAQADPQLATERWKGSRYYTTPLALALPRELPAGTYRVAVGLYDPATGQRLPLTAAQVAPSDVAGPNALRLAELSVR
jgi:hypothetical protein